MQYWQKHILQMASIIDLQLTGTGKNLHWQKCKSPGVKGDTRCLKCMLIALYQVALKDPSNSNCVFRTNLPFEKNTVISNVWKKQTIFNVLLLKNSITFFSNFFILTMATKQIYRGSSFKREHLLIWTPDSVIQLYHIQIRMIQEFPEHKPQSVRS